MNRYIYIYIYAFLVGSHITPIVRFPKFNAIMIITMEKDGERLAAKKKRNICLFFSFLFII